MESLDPLYTSGLLHIRLLCGRNLIPSDPNGLSDPYCVFTFRGVTLKSKIVWESLNPDWNQNFNFLGWSQRAHSPLPSPRTTTKDLDTGVTLYIKVMDKDAIFDDFIGSTEINITSLPNFEEVSFIKNLDKVSNGTIKLYLRWISHYNPSPTTTILDRYGFKTPFSSTLEAFEAESHYPKGQRSIKKKETIPQTGIPFGYKSALWLEYGLEQCGLSAVPLERFDYTKFKNEPGNAATLHQINLDLPRTFPGHMAFSTTKGKDSLYNILKAYSIKNPNLGYCQSMNFIAATLLLLYPEDTAFFMLCILIEKFVPTYWTISMTCLQTDLQVLTELINTKLPTLAKHLNEIGVCVSVIATRWFMCLYLNLLPFGTVLRVWDLIFSLGPSSVVLIGFCIFKMYSEDLLQIQDLFEVDQYLNQQCQYMYNWDKLISTFFDSDTPNLKIVKLLQQNIIIKVEEENKIRLIKELDKTNFSVNQIENIYHEFHHHAKECTLTEDQFIEATQKYNFGKLIQTKQDLKKIFFDYFDTNKDGMISFKEYCIGLSVLAKGTVTEKIQFAFRVFDQDNNNFIDKQEMAGLLTIQLQAMGFQSRSSTMASFITENNFAKLPGEKSELMSYEQFVEACNSEPILARMLLYV